MFGNVILSGGGSGGRSATVAIAVVVVLSYRVPIVQHHSPMLA